VSLSPRTIIGPRIVTRGVRPRDNVSLTSALWPEDAMLETRVPILLCVLRGRLDLRLGDYLLHCPEGYFCLVPGGVPRADGSRSHLEGDNSGKGECDLLWLRPCEGGLECWVCYSRGDRHWSRPFSETAFIANREAIAYFHTLVREAEARLPDWEKICRGLLMVLSSVLRREIDAGSYFPLDTGEGESAATGSWDPIAIACEYIHLHLSQSLSIDLVARIVFMSRTSFTRRFRRETGLSFVDYVTNRRVKEAQHLLLNSTWSVAVVASMVGLRPSHLRQLFIRHHGVPPSEYRARSTAAKKSPLQE
jgi:AraC-like DNA-binding protein